MIIIAMMTITWLVSLDILGWVSSSLMMNVTVAGLIHSRAWMPLDGHHYQRFYDHRPTITMMMRKQTSFDEDRRLTTTLPSFSVPEHHQRHHKRQHLRQYHYHQIQS